MDRDKFFRRLDGSNNNRKHSSWGAKKIKFLRKAPISYADGIAKPAERGRNSPNPRLVSNLLCNQKEPLENSNGLSDFTWAWGQFIDHEVALTNPSDPTEKADIFVAEGDPQFSEGGIVPFKRSMYSFSTGVDKKNPRQQINQKTSFIDATNIYGTDEDRLNNLRAWDGSGKLKVYHSKVGDLLPFNTLNLPNDVMPDDVDSRAYFIAGDARSNEHAVLTAMHTLFVREHNRLCDRLVQQQPILKGKEEETFQLARKLVGAMMQAITYYEFLPALLGKNAISPYQGYQRKTNASISNMFATASYRLGHSTLPSMLKIGRGKREVPLRQIFFNPKIIKEHGIEALLQGRYYQTMQEVDLKVTSEVRNFLFSPPNEEFQPFLDLAAINIQRGRDHGLAGYNIAREAYGLTPYNDFSEITRDTSIQQRLQALYDTVDDIDPWIGGLAEDHMAGAQVGELIYTVLKDQFERTRDGDRFWYENDPILQRYQDKIRHTTLAKVIRRNTYLEDVPDNVFSAITVKETSKESLIKTK